MRVASAFFACLLSVLPAVAGQVSGIPEIVDGDTLYVGSEKIRLAGLDAPETDQLCLNAKNAKFRCGVSVREKLEERYGGKLLSCRLDGNDRYGRNLGDCFLGDESMSRWLVRNGWALAFRRYSQKFIADEDHAREHKAGLWEGAFIAPWDWRRRNTKTVVLGALQVPRDAQLQLLSAESVSAPHDSLCTVKANLKKNECIYHVPGGRYYGKLKMNSVNRRWFCSAREAEAAGCRRSKL